MNKKGINDLSKDILGYCKQKGYLELIKKQLSVSESNRFDAKNIGEKGLDILDTIRCVLDKKRTNFFAEEIIKSVKKNDLVLEAGIGTGILSYIAAIQGAYVYGLEINETILQFANNIKKGLKTYTVNYKKHLNQNPIFCHNDAIKYKSDQKFDCIISENIYTGMFYEKQVQIMNNLIQFLKSDGKIIPSKMISYFSLCEISQDLSPQKSSLIVVNDISKNMVRSYKILSKPIAYSILRFSEQNQEKLNYSTMVKINRGGIINSMYIKANVYMPSGKMIRGSDTTFLGNDIVIPIKKILRVEKGEEVKISIFYRYGDNPKNIEIDLKKF